MRKLYIRSPQGTRSLGGKSLVLDVKGQQLTHIVSEAVGPLGRGVNVMILNAKDANVTLPKTSRKYHGIVVNEKVPSFERSHDRTEINASYIIHDAITVAREHLQLRKHNRPNRRFGTLIVNEDNTFKFDPIVDAHRGLAHKGFVLNKRRGLKMDDDDIEVQTDKKIDASIKKFTDSTFLPEINSLKVHFDGKISAVEGRLSSEISSLRDLIMKGFKFTPDE